MLNLITGTPGTGKTLYAVYLIYKMLKNLKDERKIYTNINGLKFDSSRIVKFELTDDFNWLTFEKNSIIVLDECQQFSNFAKRASSKLTDTEVVKGLATHRHHGYTMYFICQSPAQLNTDIKAIVGNHYHIHRGFDATVVTIYKYNPCEPNPNSRQAKAHPEEVITFSYPKDLFDYYTSAVEHHTKFRLPKSIIYRGLFSLVVIGCVIYLLNNPTLHKNFIDPLIASLKGNKDPEKSALPFLKGNNQNDKLFNTTDTNTKKVYTDNNDNKDNKDNKPIFIYKPDRPFELDYSNQIYKPNELPRFVGVMKMGNKCIGYTQQATRLELSNDDCIKVANGDMPFNPFKQQSEALNKSSVLNPSSAKQN
jgi:hypothetical protein